MANDEAARSMMNASWSVGMCSLAMACARLGDADIAIRLYGELRPLEPYYHVAFRGSAFQGSVARTLGVLAATAGQHEEAERHLWRAIDQNELMGALPSWHAPATTVGRSCAGAEMPTRLQSSLAPRTSSRGGSAWAT
jgi:tetratricopeptide (TPR) repeat protein